MLVDAYKFKHVLIEMFGKIQIHFDQQGGAR